MADVMITGGSEAAITHMGLGGFAAMRALSTRNDDPTRASRPFDRDRDGFVLAEGAGIVILEDESSTPGPAGPGSTPRCSATACRPTARTSPPPTRKAAAPPAP